jgi:hypothetical protein
VKWCQKAAESAPHRSTERTVTWSASHRATLLRASGRGRLRGSGGQIDLRRAEHFSGEFHLRNACVTFHQGEGGVKTSYRSQFISLHIVAFRRAARRCLERPLLLL